MALAMSAAGCIASSSCLRSAAPQPAKRCRMVAVRCAQGADHERAQNAAVSLKLMAASMAAATLMSSSAAQAGVILEKPQVKKLFQDDTPAAPVNKAKQAVSKAASGGGLKAPSLSAPSLPELNVRTLALPGSFALVALIAAAGKVLDPDLDKFLSTTASRDSREYAGFEETIKSGMLRPASKALSTGTKKVKKAASQTQKKAGGLFGKFGGK